MAHLSLQSRSIIDACFMIDYIIQLHHMTLDDIKQDQQYSHRTQLSLSKTMYRQLMAQKGDRSLAEYVRQLIFKAWEEQAKQEQKRQYVAQLLSEPMKKPSPSVEELLLREKKLRADRLI